ncbi:glycosyltransferase domain-containing protein [Escherichia coli]
MDKNIVVYTSLFGDYDELTEVSEPDLECEYICFTDQINLKSKTWKIIIIKHNNESAYMNRMYKILPHRFLSEYKASLYVDSNIILKKNMSQIIRHYTTLSNISIPKHFMRNCIYEEALFCLRTNKIDKIIYERLINQYYLLNKFPKGYGMGENNIIIRKHNSPEIIEAMEQWWLFYVNIAKRDQLSLMFILWLKNVNFMLMQETSRNKNDYFDYKLHKHLISKSKVKTFLRSASARRDRNLLFKLIGKIMDNCKGYK